MAVIALGNGVHRLAFGTVTLDGSNPTNVTTGLASVIACGANPRLAAANAVGAANVNNVVFSAASGGTIDLRAYNTTATGDAAQVASTNSAVVCDWWAIGT